MKANEFIRKYGLDYPHSKKTHKDTKMAIKGYVELSKENGMKLMAECKKSPKHR